MNRFHKFPFDRAIGSILGAACGDALGARFEFKPPSYAPSPIQMEAGGPFDWRKGQWTDDTEMTIILMLNLARSGDLRSASNLDSLARDFAGWARRATDIGAQTSTILERVNPETGTALDAISAARDYLEHSPEACGNGALMRTAPVALFYLDDEPTMIEVARTVSSLTHAHIDSQDACAIWCVAIAQAIRKRSLDIRYAIDKAVAEERRALWHTRIDEAEAAGEVYNIANNGWAVAALQAAWIAVRNAETLEEAIEWGTRCGGDTDTVAAIAGALAGAYWGASAIPARWRRFLNGWPYVSAFDLVYHPGMNRDGVESSMFDDDGIGVPMSAQDLRALAHRTVSQGMPVGERGWPFAPSMGGEFRRRTQFQWDPGVIIGAEGDLDSLSDIDVVVSLSRVGYEHVRDREHIEFWLIDSHHPEDNPNLEFVLRDAAKTIADLRAEGKRVFLHCVAAHNRTPTVAALYAALYHGVDANEAITTVDSALGGHGGNEFLRQKVRDIAAAGR